MDVYESKPSVFRYTDVVKQESVGKRCDAEIECDTDVKCVHYGGAWGLGTQFPSV